MNAVVSERRLKLLSSGSALPGEPVDNDALLRPLAQYCGERTARQARWIARRLNIQSRYLARSLEPNSNGTVSGFHNHQLCARALTAALKTASLAINDCHYLIGHTASPSTAMPPNIAWVADEVAFAGPYMELRQACTGFANALQIAVAMLRDDNALPIAIVGSETGSAYFKLSPEFTDREQLINYVQMGDGAGAVLVGPDDGRGQGTLSELFFGHIGLARAPGFSLQESGSATPHCVHGIPRFYHAAADILAQGDELFMAGLQVMEERGYALSDFTWILPHQVNGRIAELFAQRTGIAPEKVIVSADTLGNLGSAAIWVALDRLRRSGRLKTNDRVLVLGAEATKYCYGGFVYTH